MADFATARRNMVERQLARRGIVDADVLRVMGGLPREAFVPSAQRADAYVDGPLPIGHGQTISQPYVVALMAEAACLRPGAQVLEIGTGCGYSAAVLAGLGAEVHTVERIAALAARARATFERLGIAGVTVQVGDGTLGWPERAPFDAIVATAAGPRVPAAIKAQCRPGGVIVMPVGRKWGSQHLLRLTRRADGRFDEERLGGVRFVPLIGAGGWPGADG